LWKNLLLKFLITYIKHIIIIYKYIYFKKEIKKYSKNAEDVDKKDKINIYLRSRMLCSMDACWRLLGYQTYPTSTPTAVLTIKVKSEKDVIDLQSEGKLCDLQYTLEDLLKMLNSTILNTPNFIKYGITI
jgi:hypothetical protein